MHFTYWKNPFCYYFFNDSGWAGVVGSRMKYALVAAAAATICFALFGGSGSAINAAEAEAILAQYSNPKGLIMLIPVAILLIVAFIKRNMSPAYIPDMVRKLEKAMAVDNGLVYLHVYNPCVTGWGCKSDESIEVARLAVETNFAPCTRWKTACSRCLWT